MKNLRNKLEGGKKLYGVGREMSKCTVRIKNFENKIGKGLNEDIPSKPNFF
jgi:hypothetical protein